MGSNQNKGGVKIRNEKEQNDLTDSVVAVLQKDPDLIEMAATVITIVKTYAFYDKNGIKVDKTAIQKTLVDKKDLIFERFRDHSINFKTKEEMMTILKSVVTVEDTPSMEKIVKY